MSTDLTIKDTCPCGASFEVSVEYPPHGAARHDAWLIAHDECRQRASIVGKAPTVLDPITRLKLMELPPLPGSGCGSPTTPKEDTGA